MSLAVAVAPQSPTRVIRITADVLEVDEGGDFCASVLHGYGRAPVVRLERSIVGSPHEGRVRRWAFERAAGRCGVGYFELRLGGGERPPS